jgi:hypothetical protein
MRRRSSARSKLHTSWFTTHRHLVPQEADASPAGASSRTGLRKSKTKWPCTIWTPPKAKSCQVVQKRRSPKSAEVGSAPGKYRTTAQLGWINVDARRLTTFLCWEHCIICRPIGTLPFPERHEGPSFCGATKNDRRRVAFAADSLAPPGSFKAWKQVEAARDCP